MFIPFALMTINRFIEKVCEIGWPSDRQITNWVCISAVLAVALCGVLSLPVAAAPSAPDIKACVAVDGHCVFRLEPSGPYTSVQRVNAVNRQLAVLANAQQEIEVSVVEQNALPTVLVNGQYLLTVTNLDVTFDSTPAQQAELWAEQLEQVLRQARVERSPAYRNRAYWRAGFALAIALLAHWITDYFWRRSLKPTIRPAIPSIPKTGMPGAQDFQFLMDLKLTLVRSLIWGGAIWYATSLFPGLRQRRYSIFNNPTVGIRVPLFDLGEQSYAIGDVLILLGLLWGLFNLVKISSRLLRTQILRRTQLNRGAKEVITQTYRYAALALGTLILLQIWGIDLRSIALLGSALGIGIGFGFQDIAKNFGSGLVLLFERSIQVGDFIEIDEHMGVVERIGTRSITLRNLDNISVLVPNAHLIDSKVMNWNHDHPVSRLHVSLSVDYGAESKLVKSALLQAAQEHAEVLAKPSPDVYLQAFGDSGVGFDLIVWIRNPELQLQVRSDLYFRIEEIFQHYDIVIPYPQRDLHLRSGNLPVSFSPEVTDALVKVLNSVDAAKSTERYDGVTRGDHSSSE